MAKQKEETEITYDKKKNHMRNHVRQDKKKIMKLYKTELREKKIMNKRGKR